jgi:hypothetical protein
MPNRTGWPSTPWWAALLLSLTTSAQGGQLDGLEMDVLGPGELPGESMPRIALPGPGGGLQGERVERGVGGRISSQEYRFSLEPSDAVLESSNAFSDSSRPRPPAPPPVPEAPRRPDTP